MIINDPTGASIFKPWDGVEITYPEPPEGGVAPPLVASGAVATAADLTADEEADELARELAELKAEAEL